MKKTICLEFNKTQKRLRHQTGQAVERYNMIADGDRIMVCLSGGKDSYTLLDMLLQLRQKAPVHFDLIVVNLDQKQPGFPQHVLPDYLQTLKIPYHIVERDTYTVVKRVTANGKSMCGLCSRLRRGILYGFAERHGYNKIALGHHADDLMETLFLNLFHGGKIKAMPPKLLSKDKKHIVIRPLAFCRERDIEHYARVRNFPIIPCSLCGTQQTSQRQAIKSMLSKWQDEYPGRVENILRSLSNVSASQLADTGLFDFVALDCQRISLKTLNAVNQH